MNVLILFPALLCAMYFLLAVAQEEIATGPNNPYCLPQLCPRAKRHIACEKPPADVNKACNIQKSESVNLTKYVDNILKAHNEYRQRLGNGRNMTLPRAARMVVMQWSEELATLASYNVRMCKAKHDDCHNTANFKNSGQNIIMFNMTRLVEDDLMEKMYPQLITIGARTWWSEHLNSSRMMTAADVEHNPCSAIKPYQHQSFRHFAVMAIENNTHVGCAGLRYESKDISYFKLTCNYAENYICGRPIYHFRAVGCTTGANAQYKALCSKKEIFA
ncbi:venom allergen 5-like [Drosophila hydei]|uniref:Venom allergen 5-like n=1 Tax=Drosophila hydei TaxID=7224 RepID=A0A6J1LPV8_DROHY|nr:venom allergen 5-like [Drosophila hydei]